MSSNSGLGPFTVRETGLAESTLSDLSASDTASALNIPRDASSSTVPQVGLASNSQVSHITASPPVSEDLKSNSPLTFKILDTLGKLRDANGQKVAHRLPYLQSPSLPQIGLGLGDMALSNQPTLGLTAQAPPTVTPSHPAEPSHIPKAGSIESVIDGLARLASTISQDRDVYVYSKDILLDSLVVGEGLVDQADMDEKARADVEVEPSLFVGGGNTRNAMINGDADYIDLHNPAEDEMDIDEDDDEEAGCEEIIHWLNILGPQIKELNQTGTPTPCPHLAIESKSYQDTALGKIEYLDKSPSRAIILGDPPGLGKTLPAMMAIVKAIATAKRFSIVVVPSSCVDQWKSEFAKFFLPDTVRVFILRDPNISPLELLKYDVLLVSYNFVMSQYRKMCNYLSAVEKLKSHRPGRHLERPSLSIFSEIFLAQEGVTSPYLVLDEVTAVKNSNALTFAAVQELRRLAHTCIMLTGSPLDNTWMDVFAFLQFVLGHEINTKKIMTALFASRTASGKLAPPKGNNFRRLLQLLNSFVVRRPEDTIDLPALHEETVLFNLGPIEAAESDASFEKYSLICRINSNTVQKDQAQPWKHLTHALQYAMHPALVKIMHLIRHPLGDNNEASSDALFEADEIEKWIAWREELKIGDTWKSSRIQAIIDVFNRQRDTHPGCSVLVFDESVYFLDIVQIAFENMYEPVQCLRFDGRETPEKRTAILDEFERAAGAKVMLISRATGGIGLNIVSANVVILCGPWWKKEWEKQAIKRSHRRGQKREVFAFKLRAANCAVEAYKARVCEKKNRHNSKIVEHITRKDGVVPRVWDNLD